MLNLRIAAISFLCIYLFHSIDRVKEHTINFFSGIEAKILKKEDQSDNLETLYDAISNEGTKSKEVE